MNNIKEFLDKHALNPYRYTIKKQVNIVDTDKGLFVLKKQKNNLSKLFTYLKSRGFDNFPNLIDTDDRDDYSIYEYIEEIDTPKEQKALDIIYILTLLHNKTTFFQEVDKDSYKKIYEDVNNYLNYIYNYYTDIITIIESKIYMSPAEYLLAKNISKIFYSIGYCRKEINTWYNIVENNRKQRLATIHNNIKLDHLIKNQEPYLISWDKSKVDLPIYDLLTFYKNNYIELDFNELLKKYEEKYPLVDEERLLLFILLSIPDKIEIDEGEMGMCKKIDKMLDYLYKTDELIKPYYLEKTDSETTEEDKKNKDINLDSNKKTNN